MEENIQLRKNGEISHQKKTPKPEMFKGHSVVDKFTSQTPPPLTQRKKKGKKEQEKENTNKKEKDRERKK